MDKQYSIGIDLHGTLLNKQEELEQEDVQGLRNALTKAKRFANVYACTGNDLYFTKQKIEQLTDLLDGAVLETGCTASLDWKTEEILTTEKEREAIKKLYKTCLEQEYEWVTDAHRRRLTTISLFTNEPAKHAVEVEELVKKNGFAQAVDVIYSSVAVDVIPKGYNKYEGFKKISGNAKLVGIADSMNDVALILNSDYALVPSNTTQKLLEKAREKKKVIGIREWNELDDKTVVKATEKESKGVIQLLEKLAELVG
ncbi:HAD hydrolase family protein [Candidatus Micrarchaeota archaeon]|nr:HAD hydrolase family protein [Candidatus Micrarchaeota archaeon]